MSLYLWVNILSISVPLLASFHPKMALYKRWGYLFVAIFLSMIPYIIWDVIFTRNGFWSFNETYLQGRYFLDLPLEEWLFFVCIPYACVFTHLSIRILKPQWQLSVKMTNRVTYFLLILFAVVGLTFHQQAYTLVDMVFAFVILMAAHFFGGKVLRSYYITYLFMLIPFLIVNGVLTGSGIVDQVVWYNDNENFGVRALTIPIEDFAYAFSLILLNLLLFTRLLRQNNR